MARAPSPFPVFAVHALGLDQHAFDPIRRFLDETRQVVPLELLGHGNAPSMPEPALRAYVDHAIAEIAAQAPQGPVHLVGHSFGGVVAALALARLEALGRQVASLCLLGTPAQGGSVFLERAAAVRRDGMATFERDTLARWFGSEPPAQWASAIAYARAALRRQSTDTVSSTWLALAAFPGFRGLLAAQRVLCIAAEDDLSTPPAIMAGIVDAHVPEAGTHGSVRLATLPRGGHLFPLTMAPDVAAMLQVHWEAAEAVHPPREPKE